MEQNVSIKPIKLSDVERMVASIKENTGEADVNLSFEFILTTFFPTCWNNIQDALKRQYALGYITGTREAYRSDPFEDDDCFCD